MYTGASTDTMKTKVMRKFLLVGNKLHVVIATTAFSIGIDIPDI